MSLTVNDGDKTRQFKTQYELVEHMCKAGSPFLHGDPVLIEETKYYAVANKDRKIIEALENAGHDMAAYIESHQAREKKLAGQLKVLFPEA